MAARWPHGADAAADARYGLGFVALLCRDQRLELALFLYDSARFLNRHHGLPDGSSVARQLDRLLRRRWPASGHLLPALLSRAETANAFYLNVRDAIDSLCGACGLRVRADGSREWI